jgi:hypothetical protein
MSFENKKGLKEKECVFKLFWNGFGWSNPQVPMDSGMTLIQFHEIGFGWTNPLHPTYSDMDQSHSTKFRFEWNYICPKVFNSVSLLELVYSRIWTLRKWFL